MFFAECTSLSSAYPHSHTYVLSSRLTSCFLWQIGHHLVVGIHLSRMIVYGKALSFALISPRQLCCTCFPNHPLCQLAICSSCMIIVEYAFSLCTILFALSCFLFESLRYSLWIRLIVLNLLFDPLTLRNISLCSLLSRSLSPIVTSIFSPSLVVMFVLIPKSRPISFQFFFYSLKFSLLMKHVTFK